MPIFIHYLYLIPLSLSVIFSLKTFKSKWAKPYRLFSTFLMATLFVEIFAISWKLALHKTAYWDFSKSNLWIYNIYLVPQYLFYFTFFSRIVQSTWLKSIYSSFSIIYCLFGLGNMAYVQGMSQLNTYSIIAGSGLVLLGSLSYFSKALNRPEPSPVTSYPAFWIAAGSFIFHTISLPYFITINYLSKTDLTLAVVLFNILLALNIIMYFFYLIAFLCNNPSHKK
jgi:hypothetical protein